MKKYYISFIIVLFLVSFMFTNTSEARGRYGSFRVGGYTNSGKGSHYIGGYIRTVHTPKYYLTHIY